MHSMRARIVSRRNELWRIFPTERCLVVGFLKGAGERCVAIFNIESARKTHTIPIVKTLVYIGEVRITGLLEAGDLCGDVHAAIGRW